MATGILKAGNDIDNLFLARISAKGVDVGWKSNGGVDISNRFEVRGASAAIANTNLKVSNTDLAQIFKDKTLAPPNSILLSDQNATAAIGGTMAAAQYELRNTGSWYRTNGTNTVVLGGDWISPKNNFALYSVKWAYVSGSGVNPPTGMSTQNVYGLLSTSRLWQLAQGVVGVLNAQIRITIRHDVSLIEWTCVITMQANRTS